MQTLSIDDVKTIYAQEQARQGAPEGFDPKQSTRVLVHEKLQALNPVPYGEDVLSAEQLAARKGRAVLTRKQHAEHVATMRAAVSEDDYAAFARAKGTDDAVGVADAHHFAQKMHQKALWKEADRLVGEVVER